MENVREEFKRNYANPYAAANAATVSDGGGGDDCESDGNTI